MTECLNDRIFFCKICAKDEISMSFNFFFSFREGFQGKKTKIKHTIIRSKVAKSGSTCHLWRLFTLLYSNLQKNVIYGKISTKAEILMSFNFFLVYSTDFRGK